jgi:prolyl-tRNA editing enzyme YbaK/EbsC (Cys-tRNA(Pro) deacylase)
LAILNKTILLPIVEESLEKYGLSYKVLECPSDFSDTAAFCEHFNISPNQAANTILVASRKVDPVKYAVCVVLGNTRLDVNNRVCDLLGVRKASFADAETTVQQTGMQIGGVVAVGINDLPIYVDSLVLQQAEVIMGGGNRTSKILINPQDLKKIPHLQIIEGLANLKGQP